MADISSNLYEDNRRLDPLEYSDGRTRNDVVGEILDAFEGRDLTCHRKLQKHWEGDIEKQEVVTSV